MIKKTFLIACLTVLLPFTAYASDSMFAGTGGSSSGGDITITADGVPVQAGTEDPRVLIRIPVNTILDQLNASGRFFQVQYNGVTGWINRAYTDSPYTYSDSIINQIDIPENATFSEIAYARKKFVHDNGYVYGGGGVVPLEANLSNKYIDCSSYVSDVVRTYGDKYNIAALKNFGRVTSYYFETVGMKGGDSAFAVVGYGYGALSNALPGDIICYNASPSSTSVNWSATGHVEILAQPYTGNDLLTVYSCGGNGPIQNNNICGTKQLWGGTTMTWILRVK